MKGIHTDILTGIRSALASEDAAARHEGRYEAQMKSAGASMYIAFCEALRASEEFQGRKIDDKAILRLYASNKARPWWDEALKAAKAVNAKGDADRDRAMRLIQWHVDPGAALARRAQHTISVLASSKRLDRKRTSESRGSMTRDRAPTAREAQLVVKAAANTAHSGRELPGAGPVEAEARDLQDLLGEVNRLSSAVRKVPAAHRAAAFEILKVTAREIERYVP